VTKARHLAPFVLSDKPIKPAKEAGWTGKDGRIQKRIF
jgi:hypothetical protein